MQTHKCVPLSPTTISKIHFVLSGVFSAAVRWEWISSNPAEVARKPRQPAPSPKPPTAEQAARIVEAAWHQDEAWGTLVWLVMVTGMRRGEVLALRWSDVDLPGGRIDVRRSYGRVKGKLVEKATKTHQMRLVALDETTVEDSATSLISAGVDPRTVAGRLGHGGGGATTLRVYTAWVGESDRRAAEILGSRMHRPSAPREKPRGPAE